MLCCYQAIRTLISHPPQTPDWTPPGSPSPAPATESAAASATPVAFPPDSLGDLAANLVFEITFARNLVPQRPAAATSARPSGPRRYKTRKPGSPPLTPLTRLSSG